MQLMSVEEYTKLITCTDSNDQFTRGEYDAIRRWSYGDVENNGIYYHPQLTHYAHQVFEEFFYLGTGLHYADLSRATQDGVDARAEFSSRKGLDSRLKRMTFPVGILHQLMFLPMRAGEEFRTWVDTVDIGKRKIGVRAWVYDHTNTKAAVVIWLRWAKELDPERTIKIPTWFPRRNACR